MQLSILKLKLQYLQAGIMDAVLAKPGIRRSVFHIIKSEVWRNGKLF